MQLAFWRDRRRQLLVDRGLQLPLTTIMLIATALILVLAVAFSFYLDFKLRSLAAGRLDSAELPELAAKIEGASRIFVVWLALACVLVVAVQLVYTLYVSRKIAGPLLRLRRMLAELARGETSLRAIFRKRDHQAELARAVNQRLAWIDACNAKLKAGIPFLAGWLQSFRTASEQHQLPLDDNDLHDFEATVRGIADAWQLKGQEGREPKPAARGPRARVRRTRVLVDKRLQFRFVFLLLVQVGLSVALIALITRYHIARMHAHLEALPVATQTEAEQLDRSVDGIVVRFFVGMAVLSLGAAALTVFAGLKLSHRLVGPIVRLRVHLAEGLAMAPWRPIVFRKGDGMGEFAGRLKAAAEAFEEHRRAVLAALQELWACARALREVDSPETAERMIEDMKEQVRQLTAGIETREES